MSFTTMRATVLSIHLFFFNDTAPTEIYTLSRHDALPISTSSTSTSTRRSTCSRECGSMWSSCGERASHTRSEEHTSELQSRQYLVCRLLLENKRKEDINNTHLHYKHANLPSHVLTL